MSDFTDRAALCQAVDVVTNDIMSDFTDRAALCQAVDVVTDDIMKTMSEILHCQQQLDRHLESGYFMMSKARYSMGYNRLGALQHNLDDLEEAEVKVIVEKDQTSSVTFTQTYDGDHEHEDQPPTLRKRKVATENDADDLSCKLDDMSLEEKNVKNGKLDANKQDSRSRKPINWFGILVPQALRQSQQDFKKVIEHACQLATLKDSLLKLRTKQQDLMKQKVALGFTRTVDDPFEKASLSDTDNSDNDSSIG